MPRQFYEVILGLIETQILAGLHLTQVSTLGENLIHSKLPADKIGAIQNEITKLIGKCTEQQHVLGITKYLQKLSDELEKQIMK